MTMINPVNAVRRDGFPDSLDFLAEDRTP